MDVSRAWKTARIAEPIADIDATWSGSKKKRKPFDPNGGGGGGESARPIAGATHRDTDQNQKREENAQRKAESSNKTIESRNLGREPNRHHSRIRGKTLNANENMHSIKINTTVLYVGEASG